MKNELKFKNKRILKTLERQQTKAFNSIIVNLLFVPILLTYLSKVLDQYIFNHYDLYLSMCLINIAWFITISFGLYSLYKLISTEKTLYSIKMGLQNIR